MRINIKTKMYLLILLLGAIIFATTIGYQRYNMQKMALRDTKKICDVLADQKAKHAKQYLDTYLFAARNMAQTFECFESIDEENRRKFFRTILYKMLKSNPHFLSVWTIWEPYSIDTRDSTLENTDGNTHIGSFATTYFRQQSEIVLESSSTEGELFAANYYTLPKKSYRETLINPYNYSYTKSKEEAILQTNLVVPIITHNSVLGDEFVGVVGVDAPLENFHEIINGFHPFENGYGFMLSNNGVIITHPNSEVYGKPFAMLESEMDNIHKVSLLVAKGKKLSYTVTDESGEAAIYYTFAPIIVGRSLTPWSFGVAVPLSHIYTETKMVFWVSVGIGLIGLFICLITINIIARNIVVPLSEMTNLLSTLNTTDNKKLQKIANTQYDETGKLAQAVAKLLAWVRQTGNFVSEMGHGNLNSEFVLFDEKDSVGKSLLKLRDRLILAGDENKKRRLEDENRNWAAEGLASFSDVLRQNNDNFEEFGYNIISNLVKYVDASQAAFYLLNTENSQRHFIEMKASYAFEQRKYRTEEIEIGESLVGSVVQEKESIFLTDIPEDYATIRTALGEDSPRCIYIVPLIFNDEIYGVIELALLRNLEKHQLSFINKLAESIASTISSIKTNLRTTELLQQSQEQSENLIMHEEEMRQNMEELQATLEESARRETELDGHLRTLNNALATVEYDVKGRVVEANSLMLNVLGYTSDEIFGKHQSDFLETELIESTEYVQFWDKLRAGVQQIGNYNFITRFGETVCFSSSFTPIFGGDGKPEKIIQYANNITRIINRQYFLESHINTMQKYFPTIELTMTQNIRRWNTAILKWLNIEKEQINKKNLSVLLKKEYVKSADFKQLWEALQSGQSTERVMTISIVNRPEIEINCIFIPISDINKKTVQVVIVFVKL